VYLYGKKYSFRDGPGPPQREGDHTNAKVGWGHSKRVTGPEKLSFS
jgi:hypothetical protein